jgi:5-methylcytosine-specific restriction endonuclease McrA
MSVSVYEVRHRQVGHGSHRQGKVSWAVVRSGSGSATHRKTRQGTTMRKVKRQPKILWQRTRQHIWQRDQGRCQGPYCQELQAWSLPLNQAHIDHRIERSRGGSNAQSNLRVLCRRCHTLRASRSHRGMILRALEQGIIPPDWRPLVWEE